MNERKWKHSTNEIRYFDVSFFQFDLYDCQRISTIFNPSYTLLVVSVYFRDYRREICMLPQIF